MNKWKAGDIAYADPWSYPSIRGKLLVLVQKSEFITESWLVLVGEQMFAYPIEEVYLFNPFIYQGKECK